MNNQVKYFVVAENVVRGEGGEITIVNIFNSIVAKKDEMPVKPRLVIAFAFTPKDKKDSVFTRVQLTDAKDNVLESFKGTATRLNDTEGVHKGLPPEIISFIDLTGDITFDKYGIYKAKLFCQDEQIAESKFEVRQP